MARIFQDSREKRTLGAKAAPWWVEWRDNGRRRSAKVGSKSDAKKVKALKESEELHKRHGLPTDKAWAEFRKEYEATIMPKWRSGASRVDARGCLDRFEEVIGPQWVNRIDGRTLDEYVAKRLKMRGKKPGDTVSPETVRKELRAIRAALNVARRWKFVADVPEMPEVDGFGRDKPFVKEEDFNLIMRHCGAARLPRDQHYPTENFWRALLATAWVTGMRKMALLALRWEHADLAGGWVLSRHGDNKAKKDQRHIIVSAIPFLENLYRVRKPGESRIFPWNHATISLDRDLDRIQTAAGIHLPCSVEHTHTAACHLYGFHSFRYAHATYNFGRVTDRDLQEQMGHASFTTTQRYIKYAEEHQRKAYDVYLPDAFRTAAG